MKRSGPFCVVRWYLVAFNALSAIGWAYVLLLTVGALAEPRPPRFIHWLSSHVPSLFSSASRSTATNDLSRYLISLVSPYLPSTHAVSWSAMAPVQSLAALEVVHVLIGLVPSPLPTTLIQVSSRLILVWGILARFPLTHSNPFYTTMVLAWSLTEVPRYAYYVFSLTGVDAPRWLTWIRYTAFYVLYPVGAGSEALVMLSTVPEWKQGWYALWNLEARIRAAMVLAWIPGLWVMYTHMIHMRRRVLGKGKGRKLGAKPKDRVKAE